MKLRVMKTAVLTSIMIVLFAACNECDDCLDASSKRILLQDESGNNLWFGEEAIYNPESAQLLVSDQQYLPLESDETSGTVQFILEREYSEYYLQLEDGSVDTLRFALAQQKSERCCGMRTYSTQTFLNGEELDNADLITITQ
ncbi:hypothetical protein WJR50_22075 [Catalinimonas sp. 4WD22]|uniref:hypothetical protein n=1 Tax=Catalinimonas locisalis TaxID=3133978 RepID=UPI0031016B81